MEFLVIVGFLTNGSPIHPMELNHSSITVLSRHKMNRLHVFGAQLASPTSLWNHSFYMHHHPVKCSAALSLKLYSEQVIAVKLFSSGNMFCGLLEHHVALVELFWLSVSFGVAECVKVRNGD